MAVEEELGRVGQMRDMWDARVRGDVLVICDRVRRYPGGILKEIWAGRPDDRCFQQNEAEDDSEEVGWLL